MRRAIPTRELSALAHELDSVAPEHCDQVIRYALERLTHIIGAVNGYWVAASRVDAAPDDPMRGWRVRDFLYLYDQEAMIRDGIELAARTNEGDPDPSTSAIAGRSGTTRAHLRPELVDDNTWMNHWITNDYLFPRGIHDQLLSATPVAPRYESYLCFTRGALDRPFSSRERSALLAFMDMSRSFHRAALSFRGIGADPPLTFREREVLRLLLTDFSETEIARALGIGSRTVHQHAVCIYRKLTVRGRQGLMARFLAGRGLK